MSKQRVVVEEKERLDSLLSRLDILPKIQNGVQQVFVNGEVISASEIPNKTVGPEDLVVVLPVLHGGY